MSSQTLDHWPWAKLLQRGAIKDANSGGFGVILGAEAILPLFATAEELISPLSSDTGEDQQSALVLFNIFRRDDESFILSSASQYGFSLLTSGCHEILQIHLKSIISSWVQLRYISVKYVWVVMKWDWTIMKHVGAVMKVEWVGMKHVWTVMKWANIKERLGKWSKGEEIGFCLNNFWLIEGESLAYWKLDKLESVLVSRTAKSGEHWPLI